MIYTVTLNPAVDKTVYVDDFTVDAVNRATRVRQDAGGKGVNVSKTVRELGGESVAFAILGGASGSFIAGALDEAGIAKQVFEIPGDTRTNTKVVDLARGHQLRDLVAADGVVEPLGAVGADVDDLDALLLEIGLDLPFHFDRDVVVSNGKFHGEFLHSEITSPGPRKTAPPGLFCFVYR